MFFLTTLASLSAKITALCRRVDGPEETTSQELIRLSGKYTKQVTERHTHNGPSGQSGQSRPSDNRDPEDTVHPWGCAEVLLRRLLTR